MERLCRTTAQNIDHKTYGVSVNFVSNLVILGVEEILIQYLLKLF